MPGRFLEIPVFLGDYFIMPHPVYLTFSECNKEIIADCWNSIYVADSFPNTQPQCQNPPYNVVITVKIQKVILLTGYTHMFLN